MAIYLVHPGHGTHIAYTSQEVADCLANGWKLRDEPKSIPTLDPVPVIEAPKPTPIPERQKTWVEKYIEKFGKEPHHRMLPATIRAAVEEK